MPTKQTVRLPPPRPLAALAFALPLALLVLPVASANPSATTGIGTAQQAWVKQHPVASYAPEQDYGPFIYTDAQGKPLGLSVDFLQLIAAKTGLQFQPLQARPLSENLELAKLGKVDIITSLRPTPERAAFLGFTPPYVSIPAALMVAPGAESDTSLSKMKGRKVAVGKGYAVEAFVRERHPEVQWVAVPSDADALRQLLSGKVDGMVADVASLHFVSRQHGLTAPLVADQVGFEYPLSFAYRKDSPQLGEILERGLKAITTQERAALLERWMPSAGLTWQGMSGKVMLPVAALLALALGLALWRKLRRPQN